MVAGANPTGAPAAIVAALIAATICHADVRNLRANVSDLSPHLLGDIDNVDGIRRPHTAPATGSRPTALQRGLFSSFTRTSSWALCQERRLGWGQQWCDGVGLMKAEHQLVARLWDNVRLAKRLVCQAKSTLPRGFFSVTQTSPPCLLRYPLNVRQTTTDRQPWAMCPPRSLPMDD